MIKKRHFLPVLYALSIGLCFWGWGCGITACKCDASLRTARTAPKSGEKGSRQGQK